MGGRLDSRFSTVICASVFTEGDGLSTQVAVGVAEGLEHPSWVLCDNLVSLPRGDLSNYVGSLSPPKLIEVNRALPAARDL